jgi:uncharacterized protein (DUF983 family)
MTSYSKIILRGLCRRCPNCGIGRIFIGYLTFGSECPHCQESFQGIRTDDAAPWAPILVVGHLLAPFIALVVVYDVEDWQAMAILTVLAVLLALAILPLMKGVFVGLNWRLGIRDS